MTSSRDLLLVLSFMVGSVPCLGCGDDGRKNSGSDALPVDGAADAALDAAADGQGVDGPTSIPSGFEGVFHQQATVDEVNFALLGDGRFQWAVFGCDYCGGDSGRWQVSAAGDSVEVLPLAGRDTLEW